MGDMICSFLQLCPAIAGASLGKGCWARWCGGGGVKRVAGGIDAAGGGALPCVRPTGRSGAPTGFMEMADGVCLGRSRWCSGAEHVLLDAGAQHDAGMAHADPDTPDGAISAEIPDAEGWWRTAS